MSRKTLIAIFTVAAVMLLLTPKVIGLGIRDTTVNNLLALVPPESRGQFQVEEREFHGGWFSSQVVLEIQFLAPALQAANLQIQFDISHGPLLRTDQGLAFGLAYAAITPQLQQELQQELQQLPFTLPPVSIKLLAGFDQSLSVNMNVASLEYEDGDRHLTFGGLNGTLSAAADRSAHLDFVMNSLQANDSGTGVGYALGGITINSNTADMSNILASSIAELSIRELSSVGVADISVGEVRANSTLQPSAGGGDRIDILQRITITNVTGNVPLSDLAWNSEILNLESSVIRNYTSLVNSIQGQAAVNAQSTQLLQDMALLIIQNPLTLNNHLVATVYDGEHELSLGIDWAGLPQVDNLARLDMNELLNALSVKLDLSLDLQAMLRSPAAELIDSYVQEGYIVLENGRIISRASLINGELVFNGEAVPLDQFL